MTETVQIAVISDTHGLLRPEAVAALRGVDWILHAGDFGSAEVLAAVRALASEPGQFAAVRGNVDHGAWAKYLPKRVTVKIAGARIHMLHDLGDLDFNPATEGYAVVISGHSHQPRIEQRGSVIYINPGSAGPRRFRLPVTVARLRIPQKNPRKIHAEIIDLLPGG